MQETSEISKHGPWWWLGPIVYTVAFLLLASLMAPVLHWLVQPIDDNPFRRYTDRALMISALLCLIPYLRGHFRELGLGWRRGSGRQLAVGLVIALGSVVLINIIHLSFGTRAIREGWGLSALPGALIAACLVGTLEEVLFRGVMLNVMRERLGAIVGFCLTAFLFALVHFLKAPASFQPDPVMWTSGFEAVGRAISDAFSAATFTEARFWSLLLVGIVLGVAYVRTRSLWLPIGLHAGWIFSIQWSSKATDTTRVDGAWLGGADVLTGGLTMGLLALLALGVWLWPLTSSAPGPKR